jgi:hypothetical protein
LKQYLSEARDRLGFPHTAKALKRRDHQHEVDEQTGAKGDEQKNTETTKPAICCHDETKLPENRRAHKRFSHDAIRLSCQEFTASRITQFLSASRNASAICARFCGS